MLTFSEVKKKPYLNTNTMAPRFGMQLVYTNKTRAIINAMGTGFMKNNIPLQYTPELLNKVEKNPVLQLLNRLFTSTFKPLPFLVIAMLCMFSNVFGQALNDYQTNGNVTFAAIANWQRYNGTAWVAAVAVPTSASGVITIRNGHTATVGANVTLDQVVVATGGILTVNNGITLTIANGAGTDISVDGTVRNAGTITTTGTLVFNNGGFYQHNFTTTAGTIPTATWNTGSTCEIIGYTTPGNGTIPGGLGQTFSNFTWNCPNQDDRIIPYNAAMVVNGNFTLMNTGPNYIYFADGAALTISIAGNYIQSGGEMRFTRGNSNATVNIGGDFTLSGGVLNIDNGNGGSIVNLAGNIDISNGTLSSAGGASPFNLTKTGTQTYLKTGGTISADDINFTVNSGSILDMGASVLDGSTGTFTLSSGAGIITQHIQGVSTTATTGCIQVTGTKTYNTGADYTYNGIASQSAGNGLPATVRNLTIANTAVNGIVTLPNSTSVSGILTLNSGILSLGANTLTLPSGATLAGNAPGAANMVATGTGRFIKYFAIGDSPAFTFPIGDITVTYEYSPVTLDFSANTVAGTVGIGITNSVHASINTGGTATSYLARYWTFATTLLTNYTYNVSTYQYNAGDITGTEALMKLSYWNGAAWTSIANSSASGNTLSISAALTQATGPLNGNAFTGRYVTPSYYSSGNTDPTNVNNWWSNTNGTGSHPADFTSGNQRFVIQNGHNMTTGAAWTLAGANTSLEIQSGGTLTETTAISVAANTLLQVNNGGILNHNVNSISIFAGTELFGATSTINYGFAGTQSVIVSDYGNLSISGSGTKTLEGNITPAGNLVISGSTFDLGSYTSNRIAAGGTLSLDATSSLLIGGTNTFPANYTTNTLTAGSTVNYYGPGSQNVAAFTYYNLTISGGGAKTMQGNVTVNNALNLNNGNLSLGGAAYNLTIANGAAISTTASFDNTHMIICDGTGTVIKQSNSSAGFVMIFPVGTSSNFSPFTLTALTAAVAGTGDVRVRAVAGTAPGPPAANTTDLQKYWIITTTNLSGINANASFTYVSPDEVGVGGDQSSYIPFIYSGGAWNIGTGASGGGVNPMTITGATVLTGTWTGREGPQTYYSYQSGLWGTAATWTTDPSGTLSVGPSVPGPLDRVVILNGRTVTTASGYTVLSVQINEGGTLDIGNTTGHSFGDVRGQGLLRLQTNTFPGGVYTNFVSSSGGTVEYYDLNATRISNAQLTYNNLIVSNSTISAYTVYIDNSTNPINYTVNGSFTLKNNSTGSLVFRFGNPTASNNKINLTVFGDFTVNSGCSILVNNFAAGQAYNDVHNLTLYGDLTNNGTIRFTGLASPAINAYYLLGTTTYGGTNYGAVKVTFSGLSNNVVTCNGVTDFYRFIVDKGIDQTYMVDVNSSATANFGLYGPNNQGGNAFDGPPDGYGTGVYEKALFIYHGTLKLNDNISIPTITEGGQDFNLIPSACLWVNGATVSTTVVGANGTGYQAATLYGKIRVSAGSFSTGDAAGIVLGSSATPEIYVEGTGTFSASQVWSAGSGNKISYIQTGGTTDIRGNGEVHAGYMLGLSNPNTVFTMTGGTLNFLNAVFTGTQGMDLRAATGNYIVTGGTVNINLPGGITFDINTTVPFYNLNVTRASGGGNLTARFLSTSSSTISVLNDLTVDANTVLDAGTNTVNLNIGHDFNMNAASTYTPGNNTTTFDGTGGQRFSNAGSINGGTGLYNMILSNTSNTDVFSNNLIIRNNLTINGNCYLNDIGRTISVAANIVNSGTHTSQAGGGIIVNGTTAQTIGGSGNGVFGNLIINKTLGTASLSAHQTLTGNLRLVNGLLDINTYSLSLGVATNVYDALYPATTTVFSGAKMIRTAGNMSDGGVSKTYSGAAPSFVFPVGTASDYTPATIQFNSVATWGSLNVKPVSQVNPFVTSTNALSYYWKVTQTGFGGITSVSHTYRYVDADVSASTDANYIPGVYNPFSWVYINDISQVVDASNDIYFTNVNYAVGDFTTGNLDAFQPVTVFYSCATGDWNQLSTWSNTSNAGPANATVLPGSNNPVVIGDGGSNNHIVTIPAGYNNVTIGGLQINSGSTLDITTSTGHNFGAIPDSKITGNGRLKISSAIGTAAFPGGDFGNFLTTGGGTVEYYSTGLQDFVLPANKPYYNNLTLSPATGRTITMPNIDLTVYGNYSISGTGTGIAYLNATAARTLTIVGDINVTGGNLQYNNGTIQTLYANREINISNGATFSVANAGTAVNNLLYITGSLNNNGTFDMYASATRLCNTYFTGNVDKVISGTGTNEFNYLNVNKGSSRNTILNVTANNLTLSGSGTALILSNGTFRVSNPGLNFTLSTTSAFTIPATAALSVNEGIVNIGTTNNAGDLSLAGRLEIINNGIVNIGTSSENYNNDIEYSPAGNPEIIITGGTLNVNGQIRRLLNNTLGSLNYTQSGGTVTISGKIQNNTRAKFEILNSGSQFNMSAGNIVIVEGGGSGSYFGDILLTPESNNISGGTIQIGNSSTTNLGFLLNATSPLWNLTIDGTTTNKTVDLRINPLTISNNLTISGNSVFRANGFNVNIGGSLTNNNSNASAGNTVGGYQPGTSAQITTFDGTGSQSIAGSGSNLTNFANLVIATSGSVSLSSSSNIRVNTKLTLSSGTLNDGSNNITVIGNISNSAAHSSSTTSGGIIMSGSEKQTISGSGSGIFGNVTLNNSLDVDMVDNSVINGRLTFSNGNLYIDDYLLTFGVNATISGTLDADNMILMNGVISDQGVKKLYPASASDFTFPIGVAGKYTPVRYNVTANSATGSILIRPINYKHPSTYENPAATNELQYYWYAVSTGFSGLTVNHEYHYSDADALPDETDYVVGRYTPAAYTWSVPAEGVVNAASDNFTVAGVGYIDGEYTCGVNIAPSPNFQNMPIYYSRNATLGGNWTDPNAWTLNADGTGGPAPSYPQGNAVVIRATNHTITINANSQTAYAVEIVGTLAVGTTLYHSLGHIRGGGTINLTSTTSGSFVFPAGVYDEFMANTTSTIEFYNNSATPATLPLKPGNDYKPYQNVIFSGLGIKYMSAENMKVLGNLTNNTGTLNNTLHNRNITLLGNWTDNNTAATGGFVPGTGRVILNGTSAKLVTITGASTVEQFYNLQINNAAGATISGGGQVSVSKYLYLTLGNITTSATNLLSLTNTSTSAVVGGGSTSFVNGPLRKSISSGSFFNFPVGNNGGTRYGNLYVSTVSAAGNYTAQYYNHNPGTDGYDPNSKVNPIDVVSNTEYWRLNGPAATANVRVRWDALSGIIPADAASRTKLRIVEWNGTAWTNRGNVIVDGGASSGTIRTNPAVSVNGDHRFTIGVESLPTATITSGNASICDDGSSTNISISLTGTAPWTIHYKVNGANETTINNIATSPYTLVVSNAIEPLATQGPGSHIFNISYVQDATGSTGIRDFTTTTTITLNESPNPVITGNQTVAINENNVIYSTPSVSEHTYLWSYSGPAGTTHNGVLTNNTLDMHWGTVSGTGWVRVIETVTAGGCSITTSQYAVTITDTPNPSVTGPTPVCNGVTVTYRTAKVGIHTYVWSLPLGGGSIVGLTTLDSLVVQWTSTGNYSVQVAETGSSTVTNSLAVVVNPLPENNNNVTDPSICNGLPASIVVQATAPGISYQLRLNSDDSNVGVPVSSGPGGDITIPATPVVTTIYNVLATNEYSCTSELTNLSTVTVDDPPTASAGSDESICASGTFDISTSITPPSASDYSSLSWSTSGDGSFDISTDLSPEYTPGTNDLSAGSVVLTLTANGNGACASVNDAMSLIVTPVPVITDPGDQTRCDSYTLPAITGTNLTGNEAYFTGAGGTGTQYNATDVINSTTTLYIYDETTTTPNCTDEVSFIITINISPNITDPGDQTVCDIYTLPVIAGTNLTGNQAYYTGAGGTGSVLVVGSSITSTQTVYIYDETSTTPNCTDEESFIVTVNNSPAPSITGSNNACESESEIYTTTASGNSFIWTVTGGAIDSGQGTNQITVIWNAIGAVQNSPGTVEVEETTPETCVSTDTENITIHRVPVTGPEYHIRNTFTP
jgi:hypothetical protein